MRPPPKLPSLWGTKTHLQSANGCGVFRSDCHKVPFRKKDISGNTSDNEIHSGCGAGVASNAILTVSFASRWLELQATITCAPQTSRAPQLVSEKMPLKNVAAVGMSNPCSTCSKPCIFIEDCIADGAYGPTYSLLTFPTLLRLDSWQWQCWKAVLLLPPEDWSFHSFHSFHCSPHFLP